MAQNIVQTLRRILLLLLYNLGKALIKCAPCGTITDVNPFIKYFSYYYAGKFEIQKDAATVSYTASFYFTDSDSSMTNHTLFNIKDLQNRTLGVSVVKVESPLGSANFVYKIYTFKTSYSGKDLNNKLAPVVGDDCTLTNTCKGKVTVTLKSNLGQVFPNKNYYFLVGNSSLISSF